uniref:Calmodulin binding transcription activator 1 n=1 Tax=Sinocyclocheilus rhinocerous TaxID=307959 RepID=A0A673M8F1_9TELE
MWRAEGKWLPKTSRKVSQKHRGYFFYLSSPPLSLRWDFHGWVNEHGHLKIYLPKKLLECLPKCSTLPKERHRWNTNELFRSAQLFIDFQ